MRAQAFCGFVIRKPYERYRYEGLQLQAKADFEEVLGSAREHRLAARFAIEPQKRLLQSPVGRILADLAVCFMPLMPKTVYAQAAVASTAGNEREDSGDSERAGRRIVMRRPKKEFGSHFPAGMYPLPGID